jgi:uncharacterized membrane protein YhaH (DUF805 family)
MLEKLFWFGGRLGRLAYFGWSFASVAVAVVIALVLILLAAPVATNSAKVFANPRDIGYVAIIGTSIVVLWMSLALQTKRLRDMGRDPFVWIVAVWTVLLLDHFVLTSYVAVRYPSYVFSGYTPLGGILSIVYWVFLLFTPSADDSASYDVTTRVGVSPANRLKFN